MQLVSYSVLRSIFFSSKNPTLNSSTRVLYDVAIRMPSVHFDEAPEAASRCPRSGVARAPSWLRAPTSRDCRVHPGTTRRKGKNKELCGRRGYQVVYSSRAHVRNYKACLFSSGLQLVRASAPSQALAVGDVLLLPALAIIQRGQN